MTVVDRQGARQAAGRPAGRGNLLPSRYRVRIGADGGLGRDRLIATNRETGERVFLKRGADPDGFDLEAEALRAVTHQGVVRLRGHERGEAGSLLILHLVDGQDLEAWLQARGGRIGAPEAGALLAALAQAVQALHAAGFLHRDLKPANIVIGADHQPVVVDLGAAAKIGALPSPASHLTENYAAPEQYRTDGKEGPWTDIYALAALGWRLIAGRPLPTVAERLEGAALPPLPADADDALKTLGRMLEQALDPDPVRRPQDMAAFLGMMAPAPGFPQEVGDDYPPTVRIQRRPPEETRSGEATFTPIPRPGRRRWLIPLLGLLLLAAALYLPALIAYQRYLKTEWLVAGSGGGDARTIGEALARARPGATLRIAPGRYAESLVLTRPVTLLAADPDQPPLIAPIAGPCLAVRSEGVLVRGLQFRGLSDAEVDRSAGPPPCVLISAAAPRIEQIGIAAGAGAAIRIADGAAPEIRESRIEGGDRGGVELLGGAGGRIVKNVIEGARGHAILVRGGAEAEISLNSVEGGQGVLFTEGAGGTFVNNEIEASVGSALRVALGADPTVTANRITASGEAGIFVYDHGQGYYEANEIEASLLSGFVVDAGADVTLVGNQVRVSGEHGILVLDGARATLRDNVVEDNRGHGIALSYEAEARLENNELDGNRAPDLLDARLPAEP
jgi:parallel beta-helix repeat protein